MLSLSASLAHLGVPPVSRGASIDDQTRQKGPLEAEAIYSTNQHSRNVKVLALEGKEPRVETSTSQSNEDVNARQDLMECLPIPLVCLKPVHHLER